MMEEGPMYRCPDCKAYGEALFVIAEVRRICEFRGINDGEIVAGPVIDYDDVRKLAVGCGECGGTFDAKDMGETS